MRYRLFNSEFAKPGRAKMLVHPKTGATMIVLVCGVILAMDAAFVLKYLIERSNVTKMRFFAFFCINVIMYKVLKKTYRDMRVIENISLLPDGKSLDIVCHYPFRTRLSGIPIKDIKFLREDELARKLR